MLVIRSEQLHTLKKVPFDEWLSQVGARLRRRHAEKSAGLREAELLALLDRAVRSAQNGGIRTARSLEYVAEAAFLRGLGIFDDSGIRSVLDDHTLSEKRKMRLISEHLIFGSVGAL